MLVLFLQRNAYQAKNKGETGQTANGIRLIGNIFYGVRTHSHKSAQVPKLVDEAVKVGDIVRDVHLMRVDLFQPSLVHLCHACEVRLQTAATVSVRVTMVSSSNISELCHR